MGNSDSIIVTNLIDMFTIKKLSYAGAGVAVILLAVFIWQSLNMVGLNGEKFAFAPKITKVGDQAFGSLVNADSNEASLGPSSLESFAEASQSGAMSKTSGIGNGGGGGIATSEIASVDSRMVMPNPYSFNYKFVYTGDEFSVDETTMAVLKRIKDKNIGSTLAQGLKNFDFGDIDLNKFSNLTLQNISLAEERDFGYAININPKEGVISINENHEQWQKHRSVCRDQACYEAQRLQESDIPADEVLIKIANNFFAEKNIDISNYGEPVVRKDWLNNLRPEAKIYIPDRISVIYPLVVDSKKIYEENGYLSGMNVSIDVRLNKVTNMHYMTQDYESSNYETETNTDRILEFAAQGGRYARRYFAPTETKELKIGTPTLEYVKIWKFNEDKRENAELLVPAFVFPILEKPEGTYFWQERIIIPIVKELLDEADKRNNDIEPRPEPFPMPVDGGDVVIMEKQEVDETDE